MFKKKQKKNEKKKTNFEKMGSNSLESWMSVLSLCVD